MAQWSVSMEQLAAKALVDTETVIRKGTLDLFSAIVRRSPVGNPDLWEANKGAGYKRETYNLFARALNEATLADNASYNSRTGKLKSSVKLARDKSVRQLRAQFPNPVGKGYVGGRFRANWNVSVGSPVLTTTDSTNQGRGESEAGKALTLPLGDVTYLSNGLPYGEKLEFGYSTQAPTGMVRVSSEEFSQFLARAAK